jgi:hypothetical protein
MTNLLAVLVFPLAVLSTSVDDARFILEDRRRSLGNSHEETLRAIDDLARTFYHAEQYSEAEPLFRELLEGQRQRYGDYHNQTLLTMNNLAFQHQMTGKLVQAEKLFREALSRVRQNFGNATKETCRQLNNLAYVLYDRGEFAECEALFQESLAGTLLQYGKEENETLKVMNGLAVALYYQGNYSEAQRIGRETLHSMRRKYGDTNEFTLSAMTNLAKFLSAEDKDFEANKLLREALEAYRNTALGDNDLVTIKTMCSLTRLYERKPYEARLLWNSLRIACPVCEACPTNYTQPDINASRAETEGNDSAKGFTDSYVFYFSVFVGCVTAFYLASFLGWAEHANHPIRKLLIFFLLMVFIHRYHDTFSCEEIVLAPSEVCEILQEGVLHCHLCCLLCSRHFTQTASGIYWVGICRYRNSSGWENIWG